MHTHLHSHIMRRVYYTYALRTLLHKRMLAFCVLLITAAGLAYSVSLADIYANFMALRVSEVGHYLYTAVTNTETWTLVLFLGALVSLYFVIAGSPKMHTRTFSHA